MKFQFTLTVVEGSRKGKSLLFEGPARLFFGRGDDCFEVLPQTDLTAGRYHALFEIKPPKVYVTDLGSVNGTCLNGKKIGRNRDVLDPESAPHSDERFSLSHGDRITLGETTFESRVLTYQVCRACGLDLPGFVEMNAAEQSADPVLCGSCRQKMDPVSGDATASSTFFDAQAQDVAVPGSVGDRPVQEETSSSTPPPQTPPKAERVTLAGYEIIRLLGEGPVGRTYLARDKNDSNPLALKTVQAPGHDGVRRLSGGLQIISELKHPNLASILDTGAEGDRVYYVTDFSPAGSARKFVSAQGKPLNSEEATSFLHQVLEALSFLHHSKVAHGAVSPDNLLLFGLSPTFVLKISDTGVRRMVANLLSSDQEPHLGSSAAELADDVVALGATFYYLLTGQEPAESVENQGEGNEKGIQPLGPSRHSVQPQLAELVDRALGLSSAGGFESAEEMREEVDKLQKRLVRLTLRL